MQPQPGLDMSAAPPPKPQVQPCRYKTGKTLGSGSYSVVKECVHIDTGRYYAAKVINKRLMAGREHMVGCPSCDVKGGLRAGDGGDLATRAGGRDDGQASANLDAPQVRNEIAVLKKVSMGHQNILTLVDYFETMHNRNSLPRC